MFDLTNQVAIVTGGAATSGAELYPRCAKQAHTSSLLTSI